jgi:tetratricopeptide (TPR) repeat protein
MSDCEDFLANDKIVDFIWKFCFYEAISSFKSHRKRFTPSELTLLQDFIHSGIDYFDGLGSRSPQTKLRCLLYKGDLLRYEHKLIKTDDDVLEAAEECYKQAVHLDPKSASSYSKLACIYETKSPHIALNYLLRAIINNGSSAISSLLKLSSKNGLESVFSLIQNTFGASTNSSFDASLDKFKEFMDKNTSSASILIQNLTTMCLLTIAIEKVPNKGNFYLDLSTYNLDDEMLKTLVLTVCQYLNKFAPILIDQLNKSEILQERRNCPSPFEEDTGDLIESYNHLNIIPEPTLYDNVLFPIIPFILTLNEWIGYLCVCLPSLKLSVGSRMVKFIHSLT